MGYIIWSNFFFSGILFRKNQYLNCLFHFFKYNFIMMRERTKFLNLQNVEISIKLYHSVVKYIPSQNCVQNIKKLENFEG